MDYNVVSKRMQEVTFQIASLTLVNVRKAQKSDQSVIAYQIKIKKEFKMTVKAREALSNGLIWTSEDESLCGRKLQLNTRYLITGRLVGSKPWVSVCNFVEPWSALTYKQKKGFRRLYAFGCRCKVREPPSSTYFAYKHVQLQSQSPHRLAARPGYCHWETKWENKYDCQGLHSICTPVSIQAKRKQSSDANVKNAKSIVKAGAAKLKDHKSASIHLHECQWVQSEAYKECMRKREENRVDIDRQEP
ncbi:Tissue inhibitor of metalloprotease-like protein [Dinothrombium tinctorium]|uniref:Tissue inhibitor of metalloprotease-like protein n=1 Tax=Dinothrombium tinctorium TaxID=1965070 RepID=A0A443QPR1_9ACAR|nr:Tissue inhibitor of metalloprotease-like protein [Dinothrombium tinctorium]